jgi:hypothetical protein
MDAILINHYKDSYVYLLDSDGDTNQGGWMGGGQYCNQQKLTKDFMLSNTIENKFSFVPDMGRDFFEEVDVITSYLSMGYHYGIKEYRALIMRCLKKDGLLIVDLRKPKEHCPEKDFFELKCEIKGTKGRPRYVFRKLI